MKMPLVPCLLLLSGTSLSLPMAAGTSSGPSGGENVTAVSPAEKIERSDSVKSPVSTTRTVGEWMTYQTEMEQSLVHLKTLVNERNITPNEKLEALQKAEKRWAGNNPYSDKDEQARAWINDQVLHLRIDQSRAVARQAKKTLNSEGFASWRAEEHARLAPLLAGSDEAKSYLNWLETGVGSKGWKKGKQPGESILDETSGIGFVWIPEGKFTMGSGGSQAFEKPEHEVIISQAFWMGKFEVTQGQYEAVMGINPSGFKSEGPDAPVEQVSWDNAQAFIQKLNEQALETRYRLPTEAEWEYACRAGGDYRADNSTAWYKGTSWRMPSIVGKKQPNNWGLYDMLGNVSEWCQDWWSEYTNGPITDPKGPIAPVDSGRIYRGGAYDYRERYCRPTYRESMDPNYSSATVGFRIVAMAEPN